MKDWMMAGAGETNCPSAGQASYRRTIHEQSEAEEANSLGTGTVRYLHLWQGYHTSLSPAIRYLVLGCGTMAGSRRGSRTVAGGLCGRARATNLSTACLSLVCCINTGLFGGRGPKCAVLAGSSSSKAPLYSLNCSSASGSCT